MEDCKKIEERLINLIRIFSNKGIWDKAFLKQDTQEIADIIAYKEYDGKDDDMNVIVTRLMIIECNEYRKFTLFDFENLFKIRKYGDWNFDYII